MKFVHLYNNRQRAVSIVLFSALLCWVSFPSAKESQSAASVEQKLEAQPMDAPAVAKIETQKRMSGHLPSRINNLPQIAVDAGLQAP